MGRTTVRSRMLNQMIDHAKNLEKVEAIGEKLNRDGSFTQWVSASGRAWLNPSIVALSSATSEKALSRSILKACSVSTPSVAKEAKMIQPGVSSGRALDRRRRRRMQPCAHISIVVLRFSPSAGSSPVTKALAKS
jgi:hypothetical protein